MDDKIPGTQRDQREPEHSAKCGMQRRACACMYMYRAECK